MNADVLHKGLSDAVVDMDEDGAVRLAHLAVAEGADAYLAIDRGLAKGMERAGKLFEEEEYFVPELIICADAMNAGIDVLKPHLSGGALSVKRRAVIGVIEGDTHDIGKNLVKMMLESAGFEMTDLGRDVPASVFVDKAVEADAELILLSSLMTTTMDAMADVVRLLVERGIRERFKVAVGGGPISQAFADRIGADGYGKNATEAVRLCCALTGVGAGLEQAPGKS
ncbi:MAG: corrinoid protein [Spirochaetaceae bacterium]|jgi:corrinoid protein of di/trimethylamine methyltransferase|nr:corrinoid protein [Spirochaetaceae bacterium]